MKTCGASIAAEVWEFNKVGEILVMKSRGNMSQTDARIETQDRSNVHSSRAEVAGLKHPLAL
jgi:hypothetical protein